MKISFPAIVAFIAMYATVTGCLWHLAYWSTFRFNFLEFANISDLFKSTIYPFSSKIWLFVAVIIFGCSGLFTVYFEFERRRVARGVEKEHTQISKMLISLFIVITGGFIGFSTLLIDKPKAIWNILPFAISIFLGSITLLTSILKREIPDDSVRLLFFMLVFLFPASNFGVAKNISMEAKLMLKYTAVKDLYLNDTVLKRRLINSAYLGSTHEHYFFFVPDTLIVVQSNKIDALMLKDTVDSDKYWNWRWGSK